MNHFPQAHKTRTSQPPPSIRQRLEQDAWKNHPDFAHRLSQQRVDESRFPAAPRDGNAYVRRSLNWRDRTLLITWIALTLLLIVRISTAQAAPTAGDEPWGLEFRGDGQSMRTVALNTDITADITGMVARIEVSQRFYNDGQAWSEAIYRFPLPEGAAVDRLRVSAGDRILEGEIQEKLTARRQYQQARANGMVAALVEQQRANQFESRLANIGPNEEITISISFLAQVDYRDGTFGLQLPLTFTPRWGGNSGRPAGVSSPASAAATALDQAPLSSSAIPDGVDDRYLTLNIQLRTGLNLASLESRYHDIEIHPALDGFNLFLSNPDTRADRIFELNWTPEPGRSPESALMTWDGGDAVYAMLMLAPPALHALAPQPREVVFVIDTSGSMEGPSLQQAKAALYQGLDHLGADDRFNLIQFNSDSEVLFDASVAADEAGFVTAMDFIDQLSANGGTNIAPALHDAMHLPPRAGYLRQIVFVTDGSVGNEEELLLQIADDLGTSRLFTVSIGSAPNTWFMRKAATLGRGNHTHIGQLDEVEQRMTSLWSRIENPALQDICVDWGMTAETYPEIIPDLYAGEPLWLFARLPHEPVEISLCGDLNGQPWEQTRQPLPSGGSENLATLWARSKIEALEDSRILGHDAELIRLEVTAVALEFGLLTPYTSLVAVDHTPSRPAAQALNSSGIPGLLPAGSSATTAGFSATATGWKTQLFLSLFTLLVATALFWYIPSSRQIRAGGNPRPPPRPATFSGDSKSTSDSATPSVPVFQE